MLNDDDITRRKIEIDGYQIIKEIGSGGMAVVYKALQVSLGREVALKVLPPNLVADEELVHRFQREAKAAAALKHPNIVTILDVGHYGNHYYIAMENINGCTLQSYLQSQGKLAPEDALRILHDVASALDYAHSHGFVHRDVKPSNVLIEAGTGRAVLVDFGVVKTLREATQQLTRTGTFVGTVDYAAPEQIQGHEIDQYADFYALGVMAYEMLSGHVPFDGDMLSVLYAQVHEPPPPIRDLPSQVNAVLRKMLAKVPEGRYESALAFVADLQKAFAGQRTIVAISGRLQEIQSRHHRGPLLAVPLLLVALGIAGLMVILFAFGVILLRGNTRLLPLPTLTLEMTATDDAGKTTSTMEIAMPPMATPIQAKMPVATATPSPTWTSVATATTIPTPTPTRTPVPPTATPTPKCRLAVAQPFAAIWDRDKLGCAFTEMKITWSAWEAFEKGYMLWRSDIDRVYVLYSGMGGDRSAGRWIEASPDWVWPGDNPNGIGLSPPPGLHEPKRGFGWLWRTYLGGPNSKIGWALVDERGFCAEIQLFEHGFLLRGGTIRSCTDEKINAHRTTHPDFTRILLAVYDGGSQWQLR